MREAAERLNYPPSRFAVGRRLSASNVYPNCAAAHGPANLFCTNSGPRLAAAPTTQTRVYPTAPAYPAGPGPPPRIGKVPQRLRGGLVARAPHIRPRLPPVARPDPRGLVGEPLQFGGGPGDLRVVDRPYHRRHRRPVRLDCDEPQCPRNHD